MRLTRHHVRDRARTITPLDAVARPIHGIPGTIASVPDGWRTLGRSSTHRKNSSNFATMVTVPSPRVATTSNQASVFVRLYNRARAIGHGVPRSAALCIPTGGGAYEEPTQDGRDGKRRRSSCALSINRRLADARGMRLCSQIDWRYWCLH